MTGRREGMMMVAGRSRSSLLVQSPFECRMESSMAPSEGSTPAAEGPVCELLEAINVVHPV